MGVHYKRVLQGIRYWNEREQVSKVVLLYDKKEESGSLAAHVVASKKNVEILKKEIGSLFDIEIYGYDPTEYYDTLKVLFNIVKKFAKEAKSIKIDTTSTTRIASLAIIRVALMFENTEVYFIPAKKYRALPKPGSKKFKKWFERLRNQEGGEIFFLNLPKYRPSPLREMDFNIIKTIAENGGKIESIEKLLKKLGLSQRDRNRVRKSLRNLEDHGIIQTKRNREIEIILTKFGKTFI